MEALLRSKGLWNGTQVLAQDFMTTLGALTLKEKDEIETKLDKALGTIQCFLDSTCKEIARGCLTVKDNSARRKISWIRGFGQVNGSHLEKSQ
jgi:hypothetical protein